MQQAGGGALLDIFPYDTVVLVALDSILYLKMQLQFNMDVHGRNPYHIADIMYQMLLAICTLSFTFVFVTYHLREVRVSSVAIFFFFSHIFFLLLLNVLIQVATIAFQLTLAPYSIVILVVALQHSFSAGFSSMLLQAIVHRSRSLAGSDAKVKYLNIYIK